MNDSTAETLTLLMDAASPQPLAWGPVGPQTRLGNRTLIPSTERWLGFVDLRGLSSAVAELIGAWFTETLSPLLRVRHLLLAQPWLPGKTPSLVPTEDLQRAPGGWANWQARERPVIVLTPDPDESPEDWSEGVEELRDYAVIPKKNEWVWARSFDLKVAQLLATYAEESQRKALLDELPKERQRIFQELYPIAETAFLDDLVGARQDDVRLRREPELLALVKSWHDENLLPPVAAHYVKLHTQEGDSVDTRHCGAVRLESGANYCSHHVPPMPEEFDRGLDRVDPDLFLEEREHIWSIHSLLRGHGARLR